jgi:hypothetical protein
MNRSFTGGDSGVPYYFASAMFLVSHADDSAERERRAQRRQGRDAWQQFTGDRRWRRLGRNREA